MGKLIQNKKILGIILLVSVITYNIIILSLIGLAGHSAVFYISWGFMLLAFAVLAIVGLLIQGMNWKDWFFGYPLFKHTSAYFFTELAVSVVLMIFGRLLYWGIAVAAQSLILGVYLVFALSCVLSRNVITANEEHLKAGTDFFKLLRVDVEMLAEKCGDEELKAKIRVFAEKVRNSDPTSREELKNFETEIKDQICRCDEAIFAGDFAAAADCLNEADLLLSERNKLCKAII